MDTTQAADLNRWREAGKEIGHKVGVVEERKRIVALLIASQDVRHSDFWQWSGSEFTITLGNLLALIEGENK